MIPDDHTLLYILAGGVITTLCGAVAVLWRKLNNQQNKTNGDRRKENISRTDFEEYKDHVREKFEQHHSDHEALGNKIDTLRSEVEKRFGEVENKLTEISTILNERLPQNRGKK